MDKISDAVVVGALAVPAAAFVAGIALNAACPAHRVRTLEVAFVVLACAAITVLLGRGRQRGGGAGDHGRVRRRGSTLSRCIWYTSICFLVGLLGYEYGLLVACKVAAWYLLQER